MIILILGLSACAARPSAPEPPARLPAAFRALQEAKKLTNNSMRLSSPDFSAGAPIPARFTCEGENISPALAITGVSGRAKSLVLIVSDPDAPRGDWVHWTIWNLPVDTSLLPAGGSLPSAAVEGQTDFGRPGWGGPCPPAGAHRYVFKLYALGADLYLDPSATKKEILEAMEGMIIEETELIGTYERSEKNGVL